MWAFRMAEAVLKPQYAAATAVVMQVLSDNLISPATTITSPHRDARA